MQFNYNGILAELQSQLSLLSNWSTTLYYGVYSNLLAVIAYAFNKDVYLASFLYKESGWSTAEVTSSLISQCPQLSYTPHRKQGAVGSILFSGSSTFSESYIYTGNDIPIPRWTKFANSAKSVNVYASSASSYYSGTTGSLTIGVKEGTPKQYTYIAQGTTGEQIFLYSDKIDNTELQILEIDSLGNTISEISVVDNLYLQADPTQYYCTVDNSAKFDYVYFTFGDGINSKKLAQGTRILIKYAETNGDTGDVTSTGIISTINDVLYDSGSSVVSGMYVTNTDIISGGTTYEDIESIRNNAPNLFVAGYRCGTLADWNSVVSSISYIANSQVWSLVQDEATTLVSDQNKIFISAVGTDGNEISSTQKDSLKSLLYTSYCSPSENIEFTSPIKVYISFNSSITITGSTPASVSSAVKTIIYDTYGSLNSEFKNQIYQSEYISLVSAVSSIVYHDTTARFMDYNTTVARLNAPFIGFYETDTLANEVLVVNSSPQIWIKRKIAGVWQAPQQVAYSDGTDFVAVNDYTVVSDYIDYSAGTYSYVVQNVFTDTATYGVSDPDDSVALGYIMCVLYETMDGFSGQQNSIRLTQQYQITDIDTDFIFITIEEQ